MSENNLEVALVKRACPVCGDLFDGELVLNSILTKKNAEEIKNLHGKTVGYLEEPCESCQNHMKQGIIVIGVINRKTVDKTNPFKSGHFSVIKEGVLERIFGKENVDTSNRVVFLEEKVGLDLGIFKEN
jgi:hypothetical protein